MLYLNYQGVLLALLLAGIILYAYKRKTFQEPILFFSDLKALKTNTISFKEKWAPWIDRGIYMAAGLLLLSLMDPYQKNYSQSANQKQFFSPKEGIGIYLVLDQSGSMSGPVSFLLPDSTEKTTKMALLKKRAEHFIKQRPHDLIGLVSFARLPTILSPLTLNHKVILDQLAAINVVKDTAKDGTAIGYALYKTANLIVSTQEYYRQEGNTLNAIIILVSDGLQDPNPLDRGHAYRAMELEDAAAFAKKHGIKIYIINIEPRIREKKFEPNLRQMQRIAETTGGQLFVADKAKGVETIFKELDSIEKTKIPLQDVQEEYEKKSLFPYLLFFGLLLAATTFLLKNTLLRQVP